MAYQQFQNDKPPMQPQPQPAVASAAAPGMHSQQHHNTTTTVVSGGPYPTPGVVHPHVPYNSYSVWARKTKKMGKKT